MTLETGTLLSLITTIFVGAMAAGRFINEVRNIWREVNKLRTWQGAHETEAQRVRLEIERDFGKVRELSAMKDGKLDEVLRRLEVMDKKIDRLETRDERQS